LRKTTTRIGYLLAAVAMAGVLTVVIPGAAQAAPANPSAVQTTSGNGGDTDNVIEITCYWIAWPPITYFCF
jgi:hypothetical protein